MPRPGVTDRARLYLEKVAVAISGAGGHNQTFAAACALIKGFDLSIDEARPLMAEYNQRCMPPWNARDLEHKLLSADKSADDRARGYLRGNDDAAGPDFHDTPRRESLPPVSPQFDKEKLERFAVDWASKVDLLWLADRSAVDPATVTAEGFLRSLYRSGERVLVFLNNTSQGDAIWPDDQLPLSGARGVWFLCQPVDGEYHPNPRRGKMSRRSRESVTSWRYLVIESDEAPARLWLGALAQLPLRISAIYSSGRRSVHALVRLDARTEREWAELREKLLPGIVTLGADRQSMSSVRLTRLPGCFRGLTNSWQKLLYLNPDAPEEPVKGFLRRRDVEQKWWSAAASLGEKGWPRAELSAVLSACRFYERVSSRLKEAACELTEVAEMMEVKS